MAPKSNSHLKIWRDGQLINWDDANIHIMSHVVHYGSSVFEGVRSYATSNGGAIFRAPEHARRLLDSCKIYRMPFKYSADDMVQAMVETLATNDLRDAYIRPLVIRTGQSIGVYAPKATIETFVIAIESSPYLGHDSTSKGVDARISSWRRPGPSTNPTMAKAGGNYLSSQLAKMEAVADDYNEGIMLDTFGYLSEGSGMNVFCVRDGCLYTSTDAAGILHGITRDSVMVMARDLGIEVREQTILREFLYTCDEVFFCGTAAEVTPVTSVDRIVVGDGKPGPVTLKLQNQYLGIARGKIADKHHWLTPVPVAAMAGR
ncbi:MAG TPA: branched-chain amino acid transaminase [Gemmatimonadaceae bacterium]